MSALIDCGVGRDGRRMMREVVGGGTHSTLADPSDPDEDFIKSSDRTSLRREYDRHRLGHAPIFQHGGAMRTVYWLLVLVVAISGTAFVTQHVGLASAAPVEQSVVEISPVGTVKDVMKGIVDPNAMAVWDAVGAESAANGDVIEKAPKNDAEWAVVEHNALALAEAANLLLTPGRAMSRPEEANSKSQPDAPELTPTEIEKKIADNRAEWVKHAKGLQATAVKAMAAAKAHDKDGLLNVGEEIDSACESCHVVYWYPNEKAPK